MQIKGILFAWNLESGIVSYCPVDLTLKWTACPMLVGRAVTEIHLLDTNFLSRISGSRHFTYEPPADIPRALYVEWHEIAAVRTKAAALSYNDTQTGPYVTVTRAYVFPRWYATRSIPLLYLGCVGWNFLCPPNCGYGVFMRGELKLFTMDVNIQMTLVETYYTLSDDGVPVSNFGNSALPTVKPVYLQPVLCLLCSRPEPSCCANIHGRPSTKSAVLGQARCIHR
jgi:hypothetical protein